MNAPFCCGRRMTSKNERYMQRGHGHKDKLYTEVVHYHCRACGRQWTKESPQCGSRSV